jgi:hypothetical protein
MKTELASCSVFMGAHIYLRFLCRLQLGNPLGDRFPCTVRRLDLTLPKLKCPPNGLVFPGLRQAHLSIGLGLVMHSVYLGTDLGLWIWT